MPNRGGNRPYRYTVCNLKTTMTLKNLKEKFNELNELCFKGELKCGIHTIKRKTMLGYYQSKDNGIYISTYYNRTDTEYYNTLLHEMCHAQAVRLHGKGIGIHGAEWWEQVRIATEATNGVYGEIHVCTSLPARCYPKETARVYIYKDSDRWLCVRPSTLKSFGLLGFLYKRTNGQIIESDDTLLARIPRRRIKPGKGVKATYLPWNDREMAEIISHGKEIQMPYC